MQSSPSVESKIKKALSLRQITEEKRAEELAQIQYGSTAQNTVMSSDPIDNAAQIYGDIASGQSGTKTNATPQRRVKRAKF